MLAPILAFTADEAFENLPGTNIDSVHLAEFPRASGQAEDELLQNWERIFSVRDEVLKKLEDARNEKTIGSSLQAKVELTVNSDDYEFLKPYSDQLRYIFIVSQVELREGDGINVKVLNAVGEKCERCWNFSNRVGDFEEFPTVCERCFQALGEMELMASA